MVSHFSRKKSAANSSSNYKISQAVGHLSELKKLQKNANLEISLFFRSDACRPVSGSDALTDRRALCEPFDKTQDRLPELARPPIVCIRLILMKPGGASVVLNPFAETKGSRLPGLHQVDMWRRANEEKGSR